MRIVPLASVPNQAITVTLDGTRWSLAFKDCAGVTCVDVARDSVPILSAVRALAGEPVIPYRYLQTGNFLFLTSDDQLPEYALFGVSQVLVYLSAAEIAAVPVTTAGEIIAANDRVEYLFTDEGFYITTDTGDLIQDA